ncbi:MAG: cupin domain-containing protein [Microbacterium gubbeenense]|uniref:cupin domain-containing protein n=1 Tax=Microbacterium gubbeenense TaxID=159896 RepID=UPI003F96A46A
MTAFPGGTSLSFLDVYTDPAPDGICGGSPHLHTASTECYVSVGGRGQIHTLTSDGYRETELDEGRIAWFTPGTIHRAVNVDRARFIVLMSNAGLPEAGDAVMTFPAAYLTDSGRYREAAALPSGGSDEQLAAAASRRRDLAVEGYLPIRDALIAGDDRPLGEFREAAARIVADRVGSWTPIVERGPLAQAENTLDVLSRIASGDASHLAEAAVSPVLAPSPGFGMCGRLRAFDVAAF